MLKWSVQVFGAAFSVTASFAASAQTPPETVPLGPVLVASQFETIKMTPKLFIDCDGKHLEFLAREEKRFSLEPSQFRELKASMLLGSQSSSGAKELPSDSTRTDYLNVAGVKMEVIVPPYSGVPRRLAVHLHADGDERQQNKANLNAFAARHGLILVYATAPIEGSWRCICSAPPLVSALEEIRKRYDVYLSGNLFAGVSGGATFLTVQFVSQYAHLFPGTFVMIAGGSTPPHWRRPFEETLVFYERSDSLMEHIRLYYVYGDQDFMYKDDELITPGSGFALIPTSRRAFLKRGFSVSETRVPGATHVWGFSQPLMIEKVWSRELGVKEWND